MGLPIHNPGISYGAVSKNVSGPSVSVSGREQVRAFVKRSSKCPYLNWKIVVDNGMTHRVASCKKQGTKCSFFKCENSGRVLNKDFDF